MRYSLALLPTTILAVFGIDARSIPGHHTSQLVGAAYSMTNDPSGNNVIIHSIAPNGTVSFAGFTATGGKGEHDLGGTILDAFFSQAPIVVSGLHMFTVNAGSDTITMFAIDPVDPTKLRMIGKPVSSGGEFPNSIAIHPKTGYVYVLNSGKVNGVQHFKADPVRGLQPIGSLHHLYINLTTPPTGPLKTLSQVLFSEDGSKLRVSFKGNMTDLGFLITWDVAHNGSLSSTFVKTMPSSISYGGAQFGMANVIGAKDAVLVSDFAFGATVYDFSVTPAVLLPTIIPGQLSTCWVQYSNKTSSYWLSDLHANKIYEMTVDLQTLVAKLVNTIDLGDNNEPLEVTVATVNGNDYLYVLTPSDASINVLALRPGNDTTVIQNYKFSEIAMKSGLKFNESNLEGMGVYLTGVYANRHQ